MYEDEYEDFEKKIDQTLTEIFQKYDMNYQIEEAHTIIKKEYNDLDGKN